MGGDKIPPPLGEVSGGGKILPIFGGGGKRDFTNLYDENTNYDLLYALAAMKSYLTMI